MALVDLTPCKRFRNIFRTAILDVSVGLSSSRVAAANAHWIMWKVFYQQVALNPPLHLYTNPIPFLQIFSREYRFCYIASKHKPLQS